MTKGFTGLLGLSFPILMIFCSSCTQQIVRTVPIPSGISSNADPAAIENAARMSFQLYYQGRFADASEKLENFAHSMPKFPPKWSAAILYSMVAFFQEKSGDATKARATYKVVEDLLGELRDERIQSDPLAEKLTQLSRQLTLRDQLQLWETLLPLASKLQWKSGETLIANRIADIYLRLNNFNEANKRGMEALSLAKELGDESFEVDAIMTVSGSLIFLGRFQEAEILLQDAFPRTQKEPRLKLNILAQLGLAHAALGREDKSIQELEEASTIGSLLGVPEILAHLHLKFWMTYSLLKNPQAALKELIAALTIYQELKDETSIASAEGLIAHTYFQLGSFELAQKYATRAAESHQRIGNKIEEAASLRVLGQSLAQTGQNDEALRALNRALETQVKEKDLNEARQTFESVNQILRRTGRLQDLERNLLVGLDANAKLFGDKSVEIRIRNELGTLYNQSGQVEKALNQFSQVVDLSGKRSEKKTKIFALLEMAGVFAVLRDYENQLQVLFIAERHSKEINDPPTSLLILNHLAGAYNDLGHMPQAIEYYSDALRMSKLISKESERLQLDFMGIFFAQRGEHEKALSYFQEALELARQINDPVLVVFELNSIALTYVSLGRYRDSLSVCDKSLELLQKENGKGGFELEYMVSEIIALSAAALQDYERAVSVRENMLKLALKSGLQKYIEEAHRGLGNIYLTTGKYDQAVESYNQAIYIAEILRNQVKYEKHKIGLLESRLVTQGELSPYDGIIEAMYELFVRSESSMNRLAEEALSYAELGKTRMLTERLGMVRFLPAVETIPHEVLEELKELNLRMSSARDAYDMALTLYGIPEEELRNKERLAREAKERWDLFFDEILDRYPQIKAGLGPFSLELEGLPIREGETLIVYRTAKNHTFGWVVGKMEGKNHLLRFLRLATTTSEINKLAKAFITPLTWANQKFDPATAVRLFKGILEPLLDGIGPSKSLVIVPDGILNNVPFEALFGTAASSDGYRITNLLADQFHISYYPSTSILNINRRMVSSSRPAKDTILIVGDPTYVGYDDHVRRSQKDVQGETREESPQRSIVGLRLRKQIQDRGYRFDQLKYSGYEVQRIEEIFKKRLQTPEMLTGAQARENQIKSKDLTRFQYLHFAVHGILGYDIPSLKEPALVLAVDPEGKEDGFLTLSEIYGLKLNADLVTLAACETGLGESILGEGVLGLSRAFMNAGARATLVSLWKVSDESTALLMEEFYRLLTQGEGKVEALARAKRKLRQMGYENPYFWAPFILIGD